MGIVVVVILLDNDVVEVEADILVGATVVVSLIAVTDDKLIQNILM